MMEPGIKITVHEQTHNENNETYKVELKRRSVNLKPEKDSTEYNFEACCKNIEMLPDRLLVELVFLCRTHF